MILKNNYELQFDDLTHSFFIDGIKKKSVTQILDNLNIIDKTFYTNAGRIRGSAVHKGAHYYNENDLDIKNLNEAILPYIKGWICFLEDSGYKSLFSELKLYHKKDDYCGIPDDIGILKNKTTIIEIKTGQPMKWWGLQTGGYVNLVQDNFGEKVDIVIVRLFGNGKYRLYSSNLIKPEVEEFRACAILHKKYISIRG